MGSIEEKVRYVGGLRTGGTYPRDRSQYGDSRRFVFEFPLRSTYTMYIVLS